MDQQAGHGVLERLEFPSDQGRRVNGERRKLQLTCMATGMCGKAIDRRSAGGRKRATAKPFAPPSPA